MIAHQAARDASARQHPEGPARDEVESLVLDRLVRSYAVLRDHPDRVRALAIVIARNAATTTRREATTHRRIEKDVARARPEPPAFPEASLRGAVAQAMGELTMDERELLTLRVECGLNFKETAALLGLATSTVHTRFVRITETIRAALMGRARSDPDLYAALRARGYV